MKSMLLSVLFLVPLSGASAEKEHPLMKVIESELQLSMEKLTTPEGVKPYFLQYTITDQSQFSVSATLGALISDRKDHDCLLDVDVRCGSYNLDNTHQIRGAGENDGPNGYATLPLNNNLDGTLNNIWMKTDSSFKHAAERLGKVKANVKVKVEEDDPSDDFSKEKPSVQIGAWVETPKIDEAALKEMVKRLSMRFRAYPTIYSSHVSLDGKITNRLITNSDGSKIQSGHGAWTIMIQGMTLAEDGMQLEQFNRFDAHVLEGLPKEEELAKAVDKVIAEVVALRSAPLVEPYSGPAILINRASGVFFHEIFGHRIEGHRQKDVNQGQTFAKQIGQPVLPPFLSIVDDPSMKQFNGIDLNGYYDFDDEGIPGQPTKLVEDGVLKTFLLSRSPTRGFTQSNGHGRRLPGQRATSRQGNLTVRSAKQVPFEELRKMLIEECKKQNKDHGLLFQDISGGYTLTSRRDMQAFKVNPLIVYRVYVDGRPDELVRGVDIVGTPLTCFSKIIATGNDSAIFNGVCGAESGWVPVSAISPSILVEQIEIEKRSRSQDRPPILEAPIQSEVKTDKKN